MVQVKYEMEKSKNQLGALLRAGFDINKIRLGLEYNFKPKADIKIPNGQTPGSVNNSYFG